MEQKILNVMSTSAVPLPTLAIAKAVGLTTTKQLNPTLYKMQKAELIFRVTDDSVDRCSGSQPSWSICKNSTSHIPSVHCDKQREVPIISKNIAEVAPKEQQQHTCCSVVDTSQVVLPTCMIESGLPSSQKLLSVSRKLILIDWENKADIVSKLLSSEVKTSATCFVFCAKNSPLAQCSVGNWMQKKIVNATFDNAADLSIIATAVTEFANRSQILIVSGDKLLCNCVTILNWQLGGAKYSLACNVNDIVLFLNS